MKFLFSQMETGKEATRVAILSLIKDLVSADGEQVRRGRVPLSLQLLPFLLG